MPQPRVEAANLRLAALPSPTQLRWVPGLGRGLRGIESASEEVPQRRFERRTRGLGNQPGILRFIDGVFYVLLSVRVMTTGSCCGFRSVEPVWGRSVSTMLARTLDAGPNT